MDPMRAGEVGTKPESAPGKGAPVVLAALVLAVTATCGTEHNELRPEPTVRAPVTPGTTNQDLRRLPRSPTWKPGDPVREVPDLRRSETGQETGIEEPVAPRVVTSLQRLGPVASREPGAPPRTFRNRYAVQGAKKGGFAVSDARGVLIGPLGFASLWQGAGPCSASSDVTPAIHYDREADRWLLARWAPPAAMSGFHFCIALSGTSDPAAGRWYVYDFPLSVYRAGPDIAIESDAYRVGVRIGGEQRALFVLDRKSMLLGKPARVMRASTSERYRTPKRPVGRNSP